MHQIAGWWDGFELWVAGLPFIPQFLVVLVGMVPISFAIAYGLDRVLRAVLRLRDRGLGDRVLGDHSHSVDTAHIRFEMTELEPERVADDRGPVQRRPVQSGVR
ncbi:hypothetical protein ACL02S_10985 [Nocardia sp. 004]|uniref:hypothetical protein n=1 Tax=Nocardia sp. 004 TaxID=3385978 RepID=UPI0039A1B31D